MAIRLPFGSPRCLCRACGEYFSTPGTFDRHQRNSACLAPESVGLVRDSIGVWKRAGSRSPEALARIQAPSLGVQL
jgi:hypothetical protein